MCIGAHYAAKAVRHLAAAEYWQPTLRCCAYTLVIFQAFVILSCLGMLGSRWPSPF